MIRMHRQGHRQIAASFVSLTATLLFIQLLHASSFQVNPVRVTVTSQASSTLLTVRNESGERLRLQVESFAWDQNRQGEMILNATEELVVYPSLLTIEPGDQRNVRIGVKNAAVPAEKSFRVFLEELPSAVKSESIGIRILTRVGIPVFVQPNKPESRGQIDKLAVDKSGLTFELLNRGNVHLLPERVKVKGMGTNGDVSYEQDLSPWYVLTGGARDYRLKIPNPECSRIKEFTIEVTLDSGVLTQQAPMPMGICQP